MTNKQLTREQSLRECAFYDLCEKLVPQLEEPKWLIILLAKSLPTTCTFRRAIFWRGKLIYFMPALCHLSPWFNATIKQQMADLGWVQVNNNKE